MTLTSRLVALPPLILALTGLSTGAAHATADALSTESVNTLAVASCQVDPTAPLEDVNPTVVGEADIEVVPGEITVHVVRAVVTTSLGDRQECTFGVLHRDALLPQVQYHGEVTLALGDGLGATPYSAQTDIEIGNMGNSSPVDPTTEVALAGFVVPLGAVVEDPTYTVSVERKALEVVPIAVNRAEKDAAGRLLKAQLKAAKQLEKKQLKAAKSKHSEKAVAAAKRVYAKRVATAQAAYDRATTPKTVTRPVSHHLSATGSVAAAS